MKKHEIYRKEKFCAIKLLSDRKIICCINFMLYLYLFPFEITFSTEQQNIG